AYMAPEQVLAASSGPRTDLYALGCTLHEMLTGQKIFTGATSYSVMNQQVDQPAPSVCDQRPDVPAGLDGVLGSLLKKNPDDRPEAARDAYEALLPFVTEVGPLPGAVNPPGTPNPSRMYADALSRALAAPSAEPPDAVPVRQEQPAPAPATQAQPEPSRTVVRRDIDSARAQAADLVRDSRYKEAADLLGNLVGDARQTFGSTDADVVNLRLEWANALFEGGDYRGAAPAYQELEADLADRDGPDSELVLRCRMQYASCHSELGDTDIALPAMRELLTDEQRVYGPADPRTIELRRQIGVLELGSG